MTEDNRRDAARFPQRDADLRAEALKERIYVTFTALAVTVSFQRDTAHASVGTAALALFLTVAGTLLAIFVADVIASMVRHSKVPSRHELLHLAYVCVRSLFVLIAPMAVLGLTLLDLIDLATALRLITFVLASTLVVVALVAVRRLRVRLSQKVMVLSVVTALGLGVMALELAVH